jgi:hypothetical protein
MFCGCASGSREHNCGADAFRERAHCARKDPTAAAGFDDDAVELVEKRARIGECLAACRDARCEYWPLRHRSQIEQ